MNCKPENTGPEKGYNPHNRVVVFIQEHGKLGEIAMEAWNSVDPFHCLYPGGYECPCDLQNPDEYLGYAERFVQGFGKASVALGGSTPELVEELVRRSFGASQVVVNPANGLRWVSTEDLKAIAQRIAEQIDGLKLE